MKGQNDMTPDDAFEYIRAVRRREIVPEPDPDTAAQFDAMIEKISAQMEMPEGRQARRVWTEGLNNVTVGECLTGLIGVDIEPGSCPPISWPALCGMTIGDLIRGRLPH